MKCPFCSAENPPHANFCLNCGSPLDLQACKACGSINRKNAAACQMCGVPFGEPASEPAATSPAELPASDTASASHVEEAEALAKETLTFRQLFAEIEQDVNQQLAPARPARPAPIAEAPLDDIDDIAEETTPGIPLQPLVVEPPSYLQEMLAQRVTKQTGGHGWWVVAIVVLGIAFGGAAYYTVIGKDAALATWKSLTSMRAKSSP